MCVPAFATQLTLMEMSSDPSQPLVAAMVTAAKETAALLEEALAAWTWPGRDRVGRAGATSAQFLLAHSDAYPDLRGHALPFLRQAVLAGQASPRHYALETPYASYLARALPLTESSSVRDLHAAPVPWAEHIPTSWRGRGPPYRTWSP